ncbi:MAG TPA: methyltransferase domain-containing protein, partial [Candidatus Polarisedimenticolia bacterium]
LRARSVTGLDLTQRAVEEVSVRFPQHRFFRQDISDPACPVFGMFDIVTVFDVLFHILDDRAFESSITNVCRQVRPGGLLMITDILSATETIQGLTQLSRPLPVYRRLLERCGMKVVGLHPVFFLMSRAPDLSNAWSRRASSIYWNLICGLMGKSPSLGHLIGPVGYLVDRVLQGFGLRGPSVKLLVARRDR